MHARDAGSCRLRFGERGFLCSALWRGCARFVVGPARRSVTARSLGAAVRAARAAPAHACPSPPSRYSSYPPTIQSELFYTDLEKRQAQRESCRALFCQPRSPDRSRARACISVRTKREALAVFPNMAGVFFMGVPQFESSARRVVNFIQTPLRCPTTVQPCRLKKHGGYNVASGRTSKSE